MPTLDDLAHSFGLDPAVFRSDPHARYHELRSSRPVLPHPVFPDTYLLTRYEDCDAVLRDPRWSADPTHRPLPEGELDARTALAAAGLSIMLFVDPPDHTRLRRLVSKAFTPRAVEAYRPRVQQIVDQVLDEAAERGEMDVIADFGFVVPVSIICEMLGVPVEDREQFGPWSAGATRLLDGVLDQETGAYAMGSAMQAIAYLGDLIEDRRDHPRDDLLQAMIAAEEEGDRLSHEELCLNSLLIFIAGHETTTNLIGNGTNALLANRVELRRWHDDPSLTPTAVEELLRYDSPVHLTGRMATTELEVGGQTFEKGEGVVTLLAAANRDPDRFPDPDRLDLGRHDGNHLSFSLGMHHCLGAALARMEGQVALGSLVARFPHMELLTDPVEYREHEVLRGLRELRVAV